MAKLTLEKAKKLVGVGSFVEKTIKFVDANGEKVEGEVLIKRLSHFEKTDALNAWGLDDVRNATIDQLNASILFKAVFSTADESFFPTIESTGEVPTEFLTALLTAVDEVNLGKPKSSSKEKSSGVSSSSMELVEAPSKKQKAE